MQLFDKEITGFVATAPLIFVFCHTIKCAKRTRTYTCRLKPIFYPSIAPIAFDHFSIRFPIPRGPKRAGHCATFASNAICIIVDCEPCIFILAKTSNRTGINAWGIAAMHTGGRNIRTVHTAVCQRDLSIKGLSKAWFMSGNVNVILICTADDAGGTGAAFPADGCP